MSLDITLIYNIHGGTNGEVENCNYDDNVSDTPNTVGAYSTCNLAQQSCGNLDNIQNFMDYSSCTCMFSAGQVNRMQDCLNSSVSQRNNLWTNSNLWLTGTHDNFTTEACLPAVDFFTSSIDRVCANSPVSFINNSESVSSNLFFTGHFQVQTLGTRQKLIHRLLTVHQASTM